MKDIYPNGFRSTPTVNPLTTGNAWKLDQVLVNIAAADGLVLKHQTISIHNTNLISMHTYYILSGDSWGEHTWDLQIQFGEKWPSHLIHWDWVTHIYINK